MEHPRGKELSLDLRSHLKRWPAESFAAVAQKLHREMHFEIILSGEPDEEPIIEEMRRQLAIPLHSIVGLTTIRQLGLLMQRMSVVITNDSASLHLASAMDVPTVAIFGPTDANKYGPWGSRARVVRRKLFCAPCEQPQCRFTHECMRYVSAEEVVAAVRDVLAKPS
jgi:heptosyltransferase-2